MIRNFFVLASIPVLGILATGACAQTAADHIRNERRLQDEITVGRAAVLLNNGRGIIPLAGLETRKIACVNAGSSYSSVFDSILNKYAAVKSFSSDPYSSDSVNMDDLSDDLKFFNTVIVRVTGQSLSNPAVISFLLDIQKNKQLVVSVTGDVKNLEKLDAIQAPVVYTETSSEASANFAAQLIFGGVAATGKLNRDASAKYRSGQGFQTTPTRLKYSVPEDAGINTASLSRIDDIAAEAIRERATPGAVVMVVKDGKVIYNKSYGSHTYDGKLKTTITDLFDLASVTKISATTMAVMRLYEQEKIRLDTNIGAYIPKARKTNKNNIAVREVMLHQAGFVPYIPFYNNIKPGDFSRDSSAAFPVKAADNYYMRKGYFETEMWPKMLNSAIVTRGKYVYSDLSMYFMKEIVERQSGERLENYVQTNFYQPLGMKTAGFLPRNRFGKDQIVPTEDDTYFRKTLLEGYVHDQGAAMVGGVSGHAGLFSSANDLAILYQMMLNRGSYGGERYFRAQTVDMFTARQSDVSRRGLGFDRWDPDTAKHYPSALASPQTYGHTGYTGICVWVDPKYNLIYIFLSNRVHPTVSEKLGQLNIRGRIQDVIYEAIEKKN